jgi:nucleoside 2-deoxyribosyltransferase
MGMFEDVRKELEESVQRVLDKCDAIIAKLDEMERKEMESEAQEADYNG